MPMFSEHVCKHLGALEKKRLLSLLSSLFVLATLNPSLRALHTTRQRLSYRVYAVHSVEIH